MTKTWRSSIPVAALFAAALVINGPADSAPESGDPDGSLKLNSTARHETGILLNVGTPTGETIHYRLDVINDHVIRVRAAKENRFEPSLPERDGFIQADPAETEIDFQDGPDGVTIDVEGVTARISKNPLRLSFYQGDRLLLEEINGRGIVWDGSEAVITMESPPREKFLGFGDQGSGYSHSFPPDRAPLDHRGRGMLMAGISSERQYWIPFFMSSRGYGMFVNTLAISIWDMARTQPDRYSIKLTDPRVDYFVIAGPSYKDILKLYTDMLGRAPLPPRWELGGRTGSRTMGVMVDGRVPEEGFRIRWLDQKQIEATARRVRAEKLPVDYFHLDSAWQTIRNSFDWVAEIPDPAGMISFLNGLNFKVGLWQRPTIVAFDYPLYQEAAAKGYLALGEDGKPFVCAVKYGGPSAMVDFSNPEAVRWWGEKIEGFVEMGVRTFKLDSASSGFIEAYPEALTARFHNGLTGADLDNYYGALYVKTVWDALKKALKGRRAVLHVYHQSYFAAGRYPYMALGDRTRQSPQQCRIRYALNYGLTGIPYWEGGAFGAFGLPLVDQELRIKLSPYTYTCWQEASARGLPLMRAMPLEYQDDPETYKADTQFLYGKDFLVAPIITEGEEFRKVYLPAGEWVHYWTGKKYLGPGWKLFGASPERELIFVRGGAIIPMGPVMEYEGQHPRDPLTLDIYPSDESSYVLYEDDGDSYAYQSGQSATTKFSCRPTESGIEIKIGPAVGDYAGKPDRRGYILTVHGITKPGRIVLDKSSLSEYGGPEDLKEAASGWTYRMRDGTSRILAIKLPAVQSDRGATVLLDGAATVKYYANY